MSSNVQITNETKNRISFTTTTNHESATDLHTSNIIRRDENDNIKFNSALMRYNQKHHHRESASVNFDDMKAEYNQEFNEIKDYFIFKAIGNFKLYESICISKLSELNREHDDSVKTKLYSAVILDSKEKILQIKNNNINLDNMYKANQVFKKMEDCLHVLGDELLFISENFETGVIDKICTEKKVE